MGTYYYLHPCSQTANWTFSQPYGMYGNSQSYNWFSVCHLACYTIWRGFLQNRKCLVNPMLCISPPLFNQFYPWVHQRYKGKVKIELTWPWLIWKFKGQPLGYWWLLNCYASLPGYASETHQHSVAFVVASVVCLEIEAINLDLCKISLPDKGMELFESLCLSEWTLFSRGL